MAGVNKVILLGNVGADPEIKNLEGGATIARFSIATSESYTKNGEKITQTEWHRIELWDNQAKIAAQYLKKGDSVYIEGKIRTEEWVDKDGNTKSAVRIRGTAITLLGGARGKNEEDSVKPEVNTIPAPSIIQQPEKPLEPMLSNMPEDEDELPF